MPLYQLDDLVSQEIAPGFHGRMVHSEKMTFASWNIDAGATLPEHAHPHEQITTLLEGRFQLTVDGETHSLQPGMVVVIPSNVPHAGQASTACRIIDIFHPVREEYRSSA